LDFMHCDGAFQGSVRMLLRSTTAEDHAAIDARFGRLIADGAAGYREFLRRSAAAVRPLEQALREIGVERILTDWRQRERTAALRADLADLGLDDPSDVTQPRLGGEAHQFGVLYVLEGSRLGAKVLIKRLQQSGPVPAALRYLHHGEGRPLWQTFVERLERSDAVRRSPEDAIAGARAAFACFAEAAISNAAPVPA
jgi:heme oxygenase